MAEIGKNINKAAEILQSGQLVAIPTETVYGLAANALNPEAVVKIFETKNRPAFDPLIVHTKSVADFFAFAEKLPFRAKLLAEKVCPGPVTFILHKKEIIPNLVTSGHQTVGLRVPDHPLTLRLLQQIDFPLAAPSANLFGYTSPTTAQHVQAQLGNSIDYILDGGACQIGVESTIIDFSVAKPKVLRLGGLALEMIEETLGEKLDVRTGSSNPKAPGMLLSHYNPGKPVWVGDVKERIRVLADERNVELANEQISAFADERIGLLLYKDFVPGIPHENQRILSPSGDLAEAARNFFDMMRSLGNLPISIILAEWLPEKGLGRAINDRLKRAAAE